MLQTLLSRSAPGLLAAVLLLFAGALPAQTTWKSPESIKTGLRIMNQVVGHTGRLIAAKNYDQLPREGQEFEQGLAVLNEGIANESADFKTKIGPLLAKARVAANAMSEAAQTHNESMLSLTHEQFAAAVKAVTDMFPEEMRPQPRTTTGPASGAGAQ